MFYIYYKVCIYVQFNKSYKRGVEINAICAYIYIYAVLYSSEYNLSNEEDYYSILLLITDVLMY